MSAARRTDSRSAAQRRRAAIAEVHIAAKTLGLDTADASSASDYRQLLAQHGGGHASTAAMSDAQLDAVRRALRRLLAALPKPAAGADAPRGRDKRAGRPENPGMDREALTAKIEALLTDAGRPWAYAHGMAKHMFRIDRIEFCQPHHLHKIAAALVYDQIRRAKRAGATAGTAAGGQAGTGSAA